MVFVRSSVRNIVWTVFAIQACVLTPTPTTTTRYACRPNENCPSCTDSRTGTGCSWVGAGGASHRGRRNAVVHVAAAAAQETTSTSTSAAVSSSPLSIVTSSPFWMILRPTDVGSTTTATTSSPSPPAVVAVLDLRSMRVVEDLISSTILTSSSLGDGAYVDLETVLQQVDYVDDRIGGTGNVDDDDNNNTMITTGSNSSTSSSSSSSSNNVMLQLPSTRIRFFVVATTIDDTPSERQEQQRVVDTTTTQSLQTALDAVIETTFGARAVRERFRNDLRGTSIRALENVTQVVVRKAIAPPSSSSSTNGGDGGGDKDGGGEDGGGGDDPSGADKNGGEGSSTTGGGGDRPRKKLTTLDAVLIAISGAIFVGIAYMAFEHHKDQGYAENLQFHAFNTDPEKIKQQQQQHRNHHPGLAVPSSSNRDVGGFGSADNNKTAYPVTPPKGAVDRSNDANTNNIHLKYYHRSHEISGSSTPSTPSTTNSGTVHDFTGSPEQRLQNDDEESGGGGGVGSGDDDQSPERRPVRITAVTTNPTLPRPIVSAGSPSLVAHPRRDGDGCYHRPATPSTRRPSFSVSSKLEERFENNWFHRLPPPKRHQTRQKLQNGVYGRDLAKVAAVLAAQKKKNNRHRGRNRNGGGTTTAGDRPPTDDDAGDDLHSAGTGGSSSKSSEDLFHIDVDTLCGSATTATIDDDDGTDRSRAGTTSAASVAISEWMKTIRVVPSVEDDDKASALASRGAVRFDGGVGGVDSSSNASLEGDGMTEDSLGNDGSLTDPSDDAGATTSTGGGGGDGGDGEEDGSKTSTASSTTLTLDQSSLEQMSLEHSLASSSIGGSGGAGVAGTEEGAVVGGGGADGDSDSDKDKSDGEDGVDGKPARVPKRPESSRRRRRRNPVRKMEV